MKFVSKEILRNLGVVVFFIIASLIYFHPVLQGKAIYQSDIAQYKGMAKERDEFKKTTGVESYWTNSAFGGMPTYQLGANYPHDYIKKLDRLIRFLPRPADYLFLYFIGFYILMLCLKVDWRVAVLGSLAFGLSTYLIVILGIGHNAKAHALGYIPMVIGGIILTLRKKYVLGFLLTTLAMALEISANHYQMTYYFILLVLVLGLVYLIYAIREKKFKEFSIAVGLSILAVILGIATNATGLMATKEYADWSTRGKSELTINPDGTEKVDVEGLDKEYITRYSYGISESLNLYVPRLFGGSGGENLGQDSESYEFLRSQGVPPSQARDFSENLPLYWGQQPFVGAPAYLGAIVVFLFILGLFIVKTKHKWWLVSGVILSLFLSWGKNFPALTNFLIDYFPLYNKFRAVSSAQVILELCVPVLAMLGLWKFLRKSTEKEEKLKALKWSGGIAIGLGLLLLLLKSTFTFEGLNDGYYAQNFGELMNAIVEDRKAVYTSDTLRTLVYVLLAICLLWLYAQKKLKKNLALTLLGVLMIADLVGVGRRYVDSDDFVRSRQVEQPFQALTLDQQILQDESVFRVFDPSEGLNGARLSYFHKSIGGYHAAKPGKLLDLFEFHLYSNNIDVLNMLNVKYIVQQDEETGQSFPAFNEDANGPGWFIENLIAVDNSDIEIKALDSLNTKRSAVFNSSIQSLKPSNFKVDSTATVNVVDFRPNYVVYETNNPNPGFVVFSEMHYPHGWTASIDDETNVPHYRVNYALRGIAVPAGKHKIVFEFEPEVVKTGSTIALASNILLGLLLLGGVFWSFKKSNGKPEE
ncbi:YfhO family protein [Croceivirga thetidis]|uniref:YfhO family protein n=1 Tax=Croceivirga thetidis TaxID=2721623 RepID=A0ABX1GTU3_9FLAO|nr:YfhO family protein [Croceivirga thetidis]NKI32142.1 YfhO family protein [Croceivirga thetidis]